jgi:hypothetical protein
VATELLLAILVSGLAFLIRPGRRVLESLAKASLLGRIQYFLLLIPSVVLAAALWVDVWQRIHGRSGTQVFVWMITGAALWGTVLAATRLPEIFTGRASQKAPPGWPYGNDAYRAVLRTAPTTVAATLLVVIAMAAGLLSGFQGVGFRIFAVLFVAGLLASLLALCVGVFAWPAVLIPPALRKTHREAHL